MPHLLVKDFDPQIVTDLVESDLSTSELARLAIVADHAGYDYYRSDTGKLDHCEGAIAWGTDASIEYYDKLVREGCEEQLRWEAAKILALHSFKLADFLAF